MALFEKGRIVLKIAGREAGKLCVIVEPENDTFVTIAGPEVKRGKCNVLHLEPTENTIDIGSGSDSEIESAWKSLDTGKKAAKPRTRKTSKKKAE